MPNIPFENAPSHTHYERELDPPLALRSPLCPEFKCYLV